MGVDRTFFPGREFRRSRLHRQRRKHVLCVQAAAVLGMNPIRHDVFRIAYAVNTLANAPGIKWEARGGPRVAKAQVRA